MRFKNFFYIIISTAFILLQATYILPAEKKPLGVDLGETYTIDDVAVSADEFNRLLKSLKEVPHTWFCAETSTGGMTGYDARDKKGVVYEFRAKSDNGKGTTTLRKKRSR
jgi:hypothetical protein